MRNILSKKLISKLHTSLSWGFTLVNAYDSSYLLSRLMLERTGK